MGTAVNLNQITIISTSNIHAYDEILKHSGKTEEYMQGGSNLSEMLSKILDIRKGVGSYLSALTIAIDSMGENLQYSPEQLRKLYDMIEKCIDYDYAERYLKDDLEIINEIDAFLDTVVNEPMLKPCLEIIANLVVESRKNLDYGENSNPQLALAWLEAFKRSMQEYNQAQIDSAILKHNLSEKFQIRTNREPPDIIESLIIGVMIYLGYYAKTGALAPVVIGGLGLSRLDRELFTPELIQIIEIALDVYLSMLLRGYQDSNLDLNDVDAGIYAYALMEGLSIIDARTALKDDKDEFNKVRAIMVQNVLPLLKAHLLDAAQAHIGLIQGKYPEKGGAYAELISKLNERLFYIADIIAQRGVSAQEG